ncbi:hypothetical protein C7R94_03810 [Brevibacillus sp. NRRL NRS-603]|nr:hypothetical protein [Brevibacillus formosus]PSK20528.1 hypothetical protein C7R94_03810 [Brevibacillus sp. NRRL NRS-603]
MYTCMVCGYDGLDFPQRDKRGYASQEICPCCFFQSGFHDDALTEPFTIEEFRQIWIEEGAKWFSKDGRKPENWDYKEQLKRINVHI